MADANKSCAFRTSIGGQALIEGILMRGPEKQAIVVRDQEGNLVEKVEELRLIKDRHPILGWPLIRGTVNFLSSMVNGVKALMYSADFYPEEEAADQNLYFRKKFRYNINQFRGFLHFWFSYPWSLPYNLILSFNHFPLQMKIYR